MTAIYRGFKGRVAGSASFQEASVPRVFAHLSFVERVPLVLVAVSAVLVGVGASWKGFDFAWASALMPAAVIALMATIAWVYTVKRPDPRLAEGARATIGLLLVTNVMMPLSYLAMAMGGPLWDDRFLAWDRAIGFDWFAYAAFVNQHPVLIEVLRFAYQSMLPQAAIAALLLPALGQGERLKIFIAGFAIAAMITIFVSAFTPALSMWPLVPDAAARFPNLDPAAGFVHVPHVLGLRDGTFTTLMIVGGEGILTFPSFHTAFGVLLIHAFWATRWYVRWPFLALNLLMIAATPIDGGHYLVDVIAGGAIAGLAILLATAASRRGVAATVRVPAALPETAPAR